jgi:uncharacterized membrane protein (DUF4010 family)
MEIDFFIKLAYSLGIGILIGLERSIGRVSGINDVVEPVSEGHGKPRKYSREFEEFIGIRTYSILSLVGFISAMLSENLPVFVPVLAGGAVILVLLLYYNNLKADLGITTEVAAIAACGLGALCYFSPQAGGVIAVLITVMLASKRFTEKIVEKLYRYEITDTLKFFVIIFIILPILPDRTIDMFHVFNPYKLTFLIILISGISFIGYFLTKFLGAEMGLGLTGFLGGLTSSTAVTAAMSNYVKTNPHLLGQCAFATVLTNATMFGRVIIIVFILDRVLAYKLVWSIGTMVLATSIAVIIIWIKYRNKKNNISEKREKLLLSNPFSIWPAIKFAAFFTIIIFFAKIAKIYLGDNGLYIASLASGLADVDAITLTIAENTKNMDLDHTTGAISITLAIIANSIVKSIIALLSGNKTFGFLVGSILFISTAIGLIVLLLI